MGVIAVGLLILVVIAVGYTLASTALAWMFFRRPPPAGKDERSWPGVSILKPVRGVDAESWENFVSFCLQDYPDFEIVFAVAEKDDPVVALLRKLQRAYPQCRIRWIVAEGNEGPNYKVGNLIGAMKAAEYDTLILNDGDMRVGSTYLKNVVSSFLPQQIGLVTCLYRNIRIGSFAAGLQSLAVQTGFLPSVLMARKVEGLSYAFGATICTSRAILEEAGGVETLKDYLADDYQMGYRIHQKGYEIALCPYLVDHVCGAPTFREAFWHQLRWAITQRVCRPAGYFASIITHGTFLALVLLFWQRFSPAAWELFLLVCAIRILSAAILNLFVLRNREIDRYLWLLPLGDLLGTLLWGLSFCSRTVWWKERRFRVLRGGAMAEIR